jgi:cobalt-zinc-cadmium efflux system membrane fusion protein
MMTPLEPHTTPVADGLVAVPAAAPPLAPSQAPASPPTDGVAVPAGEAAKPRRFLRVVLTLSLLLVAGLAVYFFIYGPGLHEHLFGKAAPPPPKKAPLEVELVKDTTDTLFVPEHVRQALGIKGTGVAKAPKQGQPLVMPGSTALDPTRLMRVRARFNAEVMEIGPFEEPGENKPGVYPKTRVRELRAGDEVKKDQLLAVVWSIEVGGKKSDLVDALVQLRLDEQRLKYRRELYKEGALPQDTLAQTERDVIAGKSAVARAERTLRTWHVPEKEIAIAREEAEAAVLRGKRDRKKEELWARSEIRAPMAGTIVERNVGVGEYVADNTVNLFVIADVGRMLVLANPPEDYLPTLLGLDEDQMRWELGTVGVRPEKPLKGRIDEVGYILDPNQHTAVVKGYVDNPLGKLRAGQFVSATVHLPPPPDVVEVPINALVEDGKVSFLFVQAQPGKHEYRLRRVLVTHRFEDKAFVRSKLSADEARLTPQEKAKGVPPCEPLRPGERFLESGVLELRAALEDLLLKNKKAR